MRKATKSCREKWESFWWNAEQGEARGKKAGLTDLARGGLEAHVGKQICNSWRGRGREDPTGPVKKSEAWVHCLSLQTQVSTNGVSEDNTRSVSCSSGGQKFRGSGRRLCPECQRQEREGRQGRVPFWGRNPFSKLTQPVGRRQPGSWGARAVRPRAAPRTPLRSLAGC